MPSSYYPFMSLSPRPPVKQKNETKKKQKKRLISADLRGRRGEEMQFRWRFTQRPYQSAVLPRVQCPFFSRFFEQQGHISEVQNLVFPLIFCRTDYGPQLCCNST